MSLPGFEFPPGPAHRFEGAPVYLEPMMGSGERIAICAVASGPSGSAVRGLIRSETAECLYGNQAASLLGLIDTVVHSIRDHISRGETLARWSPPLAGVSLGEIRMIRSESPRAAIAGIAQLHASLCYLPALGDSAHPPERRSDKPLSAWVKQVQDLTWPRVLMTGAAMNVDVVLAPGDTVRVHFVHGPRAVMIGLISPVRLASRVNDAKIKLWNLRQLPSRFHLRELLLGVPDREEPELADAQVRGRIFSAVDALIEEARRSEIRLQTAVSAEEAADRLAA